MTSIVTASSGKHAVEARRKFLKSSLFRASSLTPFTMSSRISSSSFNDYNAQLQGSALKATRAAVSLPTDIPFHRSIHPEFAKGLDQCSARVLSLTNKLLSLSTTVNASTRSRGKGKARLEAQDDVVDNFHSLVVDVMDQLLENAVSNLPCILYYTHGPNLGFRTLAWTNFSVTPRSQLLR